MKLYVSVLLSLLLITVAVHTVSAQSQAAAGFEKLKSLEGEWQGKGPVGPVTISYHIASGGMALIETLKEENAPSMVTLYHLDGDKLVMTHYCSDGNQPSMRAEVPAGEIKTLNFTFVSVSNLARPSAGHMRELALTFEDPDHFTQMWTWRENGKDAQSAFKMERKK
ncbi:MAG: hypothetical protein L0229_28310 [Blastocatellia bacterium]|nr:hypothetical protein [Blastocatellia bacterium]